MLLRGGWTSGWLIALGGAAAWANEPAAVPVVLPGPIANFVSLVDEDLRPAGQRPGDREPADFRSLPKGTVLLTAAASTDASQPVTTAKGNAATTIAAGATDGAATSSDAAAQPQAAAPDPLLDQVEQAIIVNSQRYLVANHNSPWQIFHGVLAYRKHFMLRVGDRKQPAIEWLATADPTYDGRPWMLVTAHGAKFHPYTRMYAFEGHQMQSLALLSESRLPVDFQFRVGDKQVTIADMLQNAMMEVQTGQEVTWVLWGLNNYLRTDAKWTNQWGQAWSIEQLVRMEVDHNTVNAPCGGNHNLFALSRARDKYLKSGQPLRGTWFEAAQKINQYIELARSTQNPDGTFSSNFYKGRGYSNDMNSRFNTTGHTMEFLSVGLPDSRLNEPWVRNAVNVLSRELIQHRKVSPDCGPLYHSLNALMIYRSRLRPDQPLELPQPKQTVAAKPVISTPETRTGSTPAATPSATPEATPSAAGGPSTTVPSVPANTPSPSTPGSTSGDAPQSGPKTGSGATPATPSGSTAGSPAATPSTSASPTQPTKPIPATSPAPAGSATEPTPVDRDSSALKAQGRSDRARIAELARAKSKLAEVGAASPKQAAGNPASAPSASPQPAGTTVSGPPRRLAQGLSALPLTPGTAPIPLPEPFVPTPAPTTSAASAPTPVQAQSEIMPSAEAPVSALQPVNAVSAP
jgi:hypothetical protein